MKHYAESGCPRKLKEPKTLPKTICFFLVTLPIFEENGGEWGSVWDSG